MDILVKLTVPNFVYRFYKKASQHVAGCTTEDIMADALTAYAGLISEEVAKEREREAPDRTKEKDG